MKAALSIVLAGLLVTTPLKQVLAQAAAQDSTTVHTTSLDNNRAVRPIHVPEVTAATAPLWRAGAAHPERSTRDAIDWPPKDFLDYVVWGLALAAFVGLFILIILIADESCGTEFDIIRGEVVDTCN